MEHEYELSVDGRVVDFRNLIGELGLVAVAGNPCDPNAHHLSSGLMITADWADAEVVSPPVAVGEVCVSELRAWASGGLSVLRSALDSSVSLAGYSTHLNVSVTVDPIEVASLFVTHFALPMMMMMNARDTPGLLVRPRGGRLELGGEFCIGEQLGAALVFAIAATMACQASVESRSVSGLPRPVAVRSVAAVERPGWYVDRVSFGPAPLTARNDMVVRSGVEVAADEVLRDCWQRVREIAESTLSLTDLVLVDDAVTGARALPLDAVCPSEATLRPLPRSPFAALHPRSRCDGVISVAALTWDVVLFRIEVGSGGYAVVPRSWLPAFLDALDKGDLDELLPHIGAAKTKPTLRTTPALCARKPPNESLITNEPRWTNSAWRQWSAIAGSVATGFAGGMLTHSLGWW